MSTGPPAGGRVSAIIPTRDNPEMLGCLLEGLGRTAPDIEVVVVDNGSRDPGVARTIAAAGAAAVRVDSPFNFSLLVGAGAAAARREFLLLLNDDIEVGPPGWLEAMVGAAGPDTGPVGAVLCYPEGPVQHRGIALMGGRPEPLGVGDDPDAAPEGPQPPLDAVTGACMLVERALFTRLDGFEPLLRTNYNDVDFCLRATRVSRPPAIAAGARLVHHESASRGRASSPEVRADWLLFRTRWAHLLVGGGPGGPGPTDRPVATVSAYSNEGP